MYKRGRQRSELESRGERRRQPVNTEDGIQARQGFAAAERRHEGSRGPEQRTQAVSRNILTFHLCLQLGVYF